MITPECTASIITLHPRQTFIADLFEILERERERGGREWERRGREGETDGWGEREERGGWGGGGRGERN